MDGIAALMRVSSETSPFSVSGTLKSTRIRTFFELIGKSRIDNIADMDSTPLRKEYLISTLRRKDLSLNPFKQFEEWFLQAKNDPEPNAMQLATYNNGRTSLRTVLLKGIDEKGLVFFSHYNSRKGHEIEKHPFVSVLFLWKLLEKQVTIEGKISKCTREESETYFHSRPRDSQLATAASKQGHPLESKEQLTRHFNELKEKYEGQTIPIPPFWGGYRLTPDRFEFWQGGEHRLHDRFEYILKDNDWGITRLSP